MKTTVMFFWRKHPTSLQVRQSPGSMVNVLGFLGSEMVIDSGQTKGPKVSDSDTQNDQ